MVPIEITPLITRLPPTRYTIAVPTAVTKPSATKRTARVHRGGDADVADAPGAVREGVALAVVVAEQLHHERAGTLNRSTTVLFIDALSCIPSRVMTRASCRSGGPG